MCMASFFIIFIITIIKAHGRQKNTKSFVVNASCFGVFFSWWCCIVLKKNELTIYLLLSCLADGDISRRDCSNPKSMVDVSFTSLQWIILLISLNSSWYCYNLCLKPRTAYSENVLAPRARKNFLPAGVAWVPFHKHRAAETLTASFSLLDAAAVLWKLWTKQKRLYPRPEEQQNTQSHNAAPQ